MARESQGDEDLCRGTPVGCKKRRGHEDVFYCDAAIAVSPMATRSPAGADKLVRRVWGQSRSTDMVPFWVHCGLSLHSTTRDSVGLPVS